MKKLLCQISALLLVIGAINWGLIGLFDFNLVHTVFKTMPILEKATYILVGLAGLVYAGLKLGHDYK